MQKVTPFKHSYTEKVILFILLIINARVVRPSTVGGQLLTIYYNYPNISTSLNTNIQSYTHYFCVGFFPGEDTD